MCNKILIFSILILLGCQDFQSNKNDSSDIIAEAFGEKLYLDDISVNLKEARTESDSQFIISRYSDQWLMDKIIYEEAKQTVGENKKLNELIEDYKESLIIHEWDKTLLEQSLDTFISKSEIDTFYNRSRKEFRLQEDIVRFIYVRFNETNDVNNFKDLWKTEDIPAINQYISQRNGISFLDSDKWYYKSELKNLLPDGLYKKIAFAKPNNYSLQENGTYFFLKMLEKTDSEDDAPISFVEPIIRERIVHDRGKKILKDKKNALYQKNIQNKLIKNYSKTGK